MRSKDALQRGRTQHQQDTMAGRTRWAIDPANTQVDFSVKMMRISTVEGSFDEVEGTIVFDDDAPQRSRVDLKIYTVGIDTRNFVRDFHLRTADYLDVERFPTIAFASTNVAAVGAMTYRVAGDLTIRGVAREISLDVTCDEQITDRGERRRTFTAKTRIYRKDFGVDPGVAGFGFLVGDEVTVSVRGEAAEQRDGGIEEETHAAHR